MKSAPLMQKPEVHQRAASRRETRKSLIEPLGLPLVVTLFLWATSVNPVGWLAALAALILLCVPWWSYLRWRASGGPVPLFGVVSAMYWIYFALPLFWGRSLIRMWDLLEVGLSEEAIHTAVLMAAFGVLAMWLGNWIGLARRWTPERILDVWKHRRGTLYARVVLVLGLLLGFSEGTAYLLGAGGRQIILTLQGIAPLMAFAFFFRRVIRGEAVEFEKYLVWGFLVIKIVLGISSGWLGSLAWPVVICGVILMEERQRIPIMPILAAVGLFLFFQVGKEDFRRSYWSGRAEGDRLERVAYWFQSSIDNWSEALSDPTGGQFRTTVVRSLERVSLLSQTANVLELTPRVVPHQGWSVYSYLAVTFVPRFVWPDKPSVNESSRFYQVAYGLTLEEQLDSVSISVGYLTEGFIAFGWLGVLTVMFLQGILLDFFQNIFMSEDSGELFRSIGVVFVFYFMGIEGQLAQYLGGIVQQILILIAVMFPVLRVRTRGRRRTRKNRQWAVRGMQPNF